MKEKAERKAEAIELRGRLSQEVLKEIQTWGGSASGPAKIPFRYGPLAQGEISVKYTRYGPSGQGFLPLRRSLLPGVPLGLRVRIFGKRVTGKLAFRVEDKTYSLFPSKLNTLLDKYPLALGIKEVRIRGRPKITNELRDGVLHFSAENIELRILKVFKGNMSLDLTDQGPRVKKAQAILDFKKIGRVEMELIPDRQGYLRGRASTEIHLGKASGKGEFLWDREGLTARGKLRYTDEKFEGSIGLQAVTADRAKEMLEPKVPKWHKLEEPYALFAEGDLTFHFTDWLCGTAHVVIDPWGHFTVVGEITPQKEIELFPQKDYRKPLPPLEARARYGVPVVGNVFIFIGLGLELWATVGPAKFYNIRVSGKYSTDPEVAKDFRVEGSLNFSAAAGLDARIEGGAGVEIADHDLKAGVGLTGRAGIKGYAEATPVVGYRENPDTGRGEFFISGELELGAQPFLGLSGDFFIEVDSPWWSPLGDKEWRWPFFHKEWPLPGTMAIRASVDYVFGSRQWPKVEFGRVDFDPGKFASDLVHRRVKAGKGEKKAPARWKEKNQKAREAPPSKKPPKKPARGTRRAARGRPRRPGRARTPRYRARGPRRLETLRKRALKRRRARRAPKKGPHGKAVRPAAKAPRKLSALERRRLKALEEMRAAFAREKKPVPPARVRTLVRGFRKRYRKEFKKIYAVFREGDYQVWVTYNPIKEVTKGKSSEEKLDEKEIDLYRSTPKCPTKYEIKNEQVIFKTFYLPKPKFESADIFKTKLLEFLQGKKVPEKVERKTAQASRWEQEVGPEAKKKADEMQEKRLSKEKRVSSEDIEKINKIIKEEKAYLKPRWDRTGKETEFHIDHIVEWALSHKDDAENYILFEARANESSGGVYRWYLPKLRRAIKKLGGREGLFKIEEIKEGRGKVEGSEDKVWKKKEIKEGDHLKVFFEKRVWEKLSKRKKKCTR